jgi:hypothetical protein
VTFSERATHLTHRFQLLIPRTLVKLDACLEILDVLLFALSELALRDPVLDFALIYVSENERRVEREVGYKAL